MKVKVALVFSLLLNFAGGLWLLVDLTSQPRNRVGILNSNVRVAGGLQSAPVLFVLPKGLTVRDASPRGLAAIDMFEPHRFTIVVTSDDDGLVNYSRSTNQAQFEEYYSASSK
jgi:hypothetical protein